MLPQIKGKVWKFGDNISTDYMAPGYIKQRGLPEYEEALYCMHSNRPNWARKVNAGDIIVGGKNFGCGSSRMEAPRNLNLLGISSIVAESFGRIFFRNAISQGIPTLTCKGVTEVVEEGDILQINVQTGELFNLTTTRLLVTNPLPDLVLNILESGGIIAMLKNEYQN